MLTIRPGACAEHRLQRAPSQPEGRGQVGLEHRVPFLVAERRSEIVAADPGIVHQHEDGTVEAGLQCSEQLVGRVRVRDVGGQRDRLAAVALDLS